MSSKKILATVGSREISEQDLNSLIDDLDPERAAYFNTEKGRHQLLEDMIVQELIYLDAIKNGLDKNEDFIEAADKMYESFLKQFATHRMLKNITVTEDEVLEFYNENKNMLAEPETIQASHILVKEEKLAEQIEKELKEGLSFEDAATKYSECPSNANGGDLGYFARGKMVPEFEEIAFDMEVGETSGPVKTQFGYHIIKLVDRKEGSISDFEEIKEQLGKQVRAVKQQKAYVDKANELKKEYEIVINE